MQDRYVGDIGDFAKYALLRRLAGLPGQRPMRVAVVWCLFPDESHNSDGRHISYLGRPEFAGLDDELLVVLREIVHSGSRCISAVAAGGVLPCGTVFYDAPMASPKIARLTRTERARHRLIWLENCLSHTDGGELVFFDPDNGFEVPSVPAPSERRKIHLLGRTCSILETWPNTTHLPSSQPDDARSSAGPRIGDPHPSRIRRRYGEATCVSTWLLWGFLAGVSLLWPGVGDGTPSPCAFK